MSPFICIDKKRKEFITAMYEEVLRICYVVCFF